MKDLKFDKDLYKIPQKYQKETIPLTTLLRDVGILDDESCEDCGCSLITRTEPRGAGKSEIVNYCPGCGATST